ncbi:MAG TPA: DUF3782 domain-containing protein [Candidatus Acidoferrales bacterium]|nr:DUF3782 domain-containing protein [Candidatus Acidoferrales bacterium]
MATKKRTTKPSAGDSRGRLRRELLTLLRQDPSFRQRLQEILSDFFPSRAEVSELKALREDFQKFAAEALRRFEAMDRRFEAMDRRFESVLKELRTQRLHLSRLSNRLGYGLEYLVREIVEEFAGKSLVRSERLVLQDREGEVFGVPAEIEFDLFASDGQAYLCEVKSHIEPDDVLTFNRKAEFAAKHIGRPFSRVMIGASMEKRAGQLMSSLGIQSIVRAVIEPEPPEPSS